MYNYQKLLNPHEKVYFFGGMHWMVMAGSFIMLLLMTYAGLKIDMFLHARETYPYARDFATGAWEWRWTNPWNWLSFLPWVFIAIGVLWVMADAIRYLSTRVLLTSHRVIVKSGWIMVNIKEVEMEEIKAARIDQMLFGRFFGYGKVYLDARFVQDNVLPLMSRPFDLVKLLHTIRDHHIAEQDDIAEPIASEDLPFMKAGGAVQNQSAIDEIPEVKAMQPELHKKQMSEEEKLALYKKANYKEDLEFIQQQIHHGPAVTEKDVQKVQKPDAEPASAEKQDDDKAVPVSGQDVAPAKTLGPDEEHAPMAEDAKDAEDTKDNAKEDIQADAQNNAENDVETENDPTNVRTLGITQEDVEFLHKMRRKNKSAA